MLAPVIETIPSQLQMTDYNPYAATKAVDVIIPDDYLAGD